ncbi:MAG: FAD-dependent oxidoreductase [Planctomycetota bacterium]
MKELSVVIKDNLCKGCAICAEICPKKRLAISEEPTANGYLCAYVIDAKYRIPPCNNACPTGEKIQGYIDLINQSSNLGNIRKAWELLTADNPFPAVCGRVCFHPCEESCNRGDYDDTIGIHHIERFIGDAGLNNSFKWNLPKINKSYKIAIIGGGPAGLACAYHLRRLGYQSTIFEADDKLGGLLTQGIPGYRLPQNIVHAEINRIIKSGVKVRLNTRIGKDYDFEKLISEYNAVFIAIGAHQERKLNIAGEDNPSVIPALKLLYNLSRSSQTLMHLHPVRSEDEEENELRHRSVSATLDTSNGARKRRINIGQRVGIIGGGNAAMDAARSILRAGKKPIIIYRRTENEMPAIPDEINEAKEEGMEFVFLAAPERIIIRNNKIVALECIRMKLGPVDKSGRRKPIPIRNSNFHVKLDTVIPAIGEEVYTNDMPDSINDNNRIKVLNDGISTSIEGVFAGGDAVTGPKTIVEALSAGKKAATLIHYYLKKETFTPLPSQKSIAFEDLNIDYLEHKVMTQPIKLPLTLRLNSFTEVYKGYNIKQVLEESARCFNCGGCRTCLECELHCPDMALEVKVEK